MYLLGHMQYLPTIRIHHPLVSGEKKNQSDNVRNRYGRCLRQGHPGFEVLFGLYVHRGDVSMSKVFLIVIIRRLLHTSFKKNVFAEKVISLDPKSRKAKLLLNC